VLCQKGKLGDGLQIAEIEDVSTPVENSPFRWLKTPAPSKVVVDCFGRRMRSGAQSSGQRDGLDGPPGLQCASGRDVPVGNNCLFVDESRGTSCSCFRP
jgi:hypothetical protein